VPLVDKLIVAGRDFDRQLENLGSLKLREVLDRFPELGDLTLNQIDLKDFAITDIPNVKRIPIQ